MSSSILGFNKDQTLASIVNVVKGENIHIDDMFMDGNEITEISSDGTLTSDSDKKLSTQKAIKTYVDNSVCTDHGALTGLTDDDHSQYALLSGRTGDSLIIDSVQCPSLFSSIVDASDITVENQNGSNSVILKVVGNQLTANSSGIALSSGSIVNSIKDEDNMTSNSDTSLSTQQSIKAYVDSSISSSSYWSRSGTVVSPSTVDDDINIIGNGSGSYSPYAQYTGHTSSGPAYNRSEMQLWIGDMAATTCFNFRVSNSSSVMIDAFRIENNKVSTMGLPFNVNTINEYTTDSGVTIDSVLLKDNDVTANNVNTDSINEKTLNGGVTIENTLLNNGDITMTSSIGESTLTLTSIGSDDFNYVIYKYGTTTRAIDTVTSNTRSWDNASNVMMYISLLTPVYSNSVSGRDVFVTAAGQLGYNSSTLESKMNIEDIGDTTWIYDLDVKKYNKRKKNELDEFTDNPEPFKQYGVIAEECVPIHEEAICDYNYDSEGAKTKLMGVRYKSISMATLKEVQRRNTGLEVLPDGTLKAYPTYDNEITTDIRDLSIDSSGIIGYMPSRKETKTNINYNKDYSWILKLKPVTFNYRKKFNGKYIAESEKDTEYGLVAEDVEKINKDMCIYNRDEKLMGVNYRKLIVPTISVIKKLKNELEKNSKIIKGLSSRLALLEYTKG